MKTKTKIILLSGVLLMGAAYYAGVVVTHQQAAPVPTKAKPVTHPVAAGAPRNPLPDGSTNVDKTDPGELPPNSAAAKLSQKELAALIQGNPVAAAYASKITGDLNFNYIAIRITKQWTADDPQAALAWAQGLPAGVAHDDSIKLIFTLLAMKDPATALSFAQSLPEQGSNVRMLAMDGLANVAATLSMQDPTQAAAMLSDMHRTESKISIDNPTAEVTASLIAHDPSAATQWINALPTGNTKDSAILAVVDVMGNSDPATAFSWLRTMSNAGTRGTTTSKLIAQWAQKDPDAARAAVMNAYPNNNNGRQAALLEIIQQNLPRAQTNAQ